MGWSNSQIMHNWTLFSGHSLSGCLFLHFEQKMDNARFDYACFCLTYRVSICEEKELIISVLKSSNIFPISSLVAPPLADFCTLEKVVSLVADLFVVDPHEHFLQIFTMSS